jgi:hypothetical protein
MDTLRILTKSGSCYEIDERGIVKKYNSEGVGVDAFKVYVMKAVPVDVENMGEVWDLPESEPEVGKLLYVGGKDGWWLSTEVVRIEKSELWPPARFRDTSNGE